MSCADLVAVIEGYTCTGTLEIDGVPLSTKAWSTTNLLPLWALGPVRGTNVAVPSFEGEYPFPKRLTAYDVTLPMVITGCHDPAGAAYDDPMVGLQANLTFLINTIVAQPITATRPAELTMPDGTTRSGDVQVTRLQLGDQSGGLWRATLDLTIPAGVLA